jgi:hypothetical protein
MATIAAGPRIGPEHAKDVADVGSHRRQSGELIDGVWRRPSATRAMIGCARQRLCYLDD